MALTLPWRQRRHLVCALASSVALLLPTPTQSLTLRNCTNYWWLLDVWASWVEGLECEWLDPWWPAGHHTKDCANCLWSGWSGVAGAVFYDVTITVCRRRSVCHLLVSDLPQLTSTSAGICISISRFHQVWFALLLYGLSVCDIQIGLLWDIVSNNGLCRSVALLQFLLSLVDKDNLPGSHHLPRHHLHHHLDVGQVLAARLSTSQSRSVHFICQSTELHFYLLSDIPPPCQ